jgi:predicted O-methyltransferase YrrM
MKPTHRYELAELLAGTGNREGAEVGVHGGRFSEMLCKSNPDLHMTCVDNWGRITHHELIYAEAVERLSHYNATIIRKKSIDGAKDIPDESLDFVYIDAGHDYNSVKEDVEAWVPKVKVGGIVAGDDYYVMKSGNRGVIDAVDEYVKAHGYKLNIIPFSHLDRRDRVPQWYFTK